MNECEEYNVKLVSAIGLELSINPDISRGKARASLQRDYSCQRRPKASPRFPMHWREVRLGGPQDWNDLKRDELLVRSHPKSRASSFLVVMSFTE